MEEGDNVFGLVLLADRTNQQRNNSEDKTKVSSSSVFIRFTYKAKHFERLEMFVGVVKEE